MKKRDYKLYPFLLCFLLSNGIDVRTHEMGQSCQVIELSKVSGITVGNANRLIVHL